MAGQDPHFKNNTEKALNRVAFWVKFLGVLYRLLLISGLIFLLVLVGMLLFTAVFAAWVLIFPILLILTGIFLAWLEYRLDARLYWLKNHPGDGDSEDNSGQP